MHDPSGSNSKILADQVPALQASFPFKILYSPREREHLRESRFSCQLPYDFENSQILKFQLVHF